ncbi:MAG: RagB/SusD family nutrient uptake outer membrane protein [Bacteroidaceae bacterium]|nr:RagB/SusD family nutrient uptake outer membrane protein [Bacteroidaceae bacterium]
MKKYIFKTILCSAMALPVLTSCELDQFPEGSIPTEQAWQKVSDANNFYIGLLSNLRSVSGGSYKYVSECQADLFNAVRGAASQNLVHDWTFTTSQFGGDVVWSGNYGLITTANNIINNIDNVKVESENDQMVVNIIKGTAYFARAYAYNNMVTRYCVNYDAATASTAMGLPIVKTVDVNARPSRASLQATYDLIMSDITTAEALLDGTGYDTSAPNGHTLAALKARVLLNMKNYEEAISVANSVMALYPLSPSADYAEMWVGDYELNDGVYETIYQPLLTVDERSGSYGTLFISYNTATSTNNPYYVPTQGLIDLYEKGDVRKSAFFIKTKISPATGKESGTGYMFYKFPGNESLLKAGETTGVTGNTFYNMSKPFRVAEMYLIAAEAALLKDAKDESAALTYLNNLRTKRGAAALTSTGDVLVQDMKNEWVREFVGEGFRLDCLKRWNEGVKRMAPQSFGGANILINNPTTSYTELNIQPTDNLYYKMIWEIPSQDMQSNSNLVGNWTSN